MAGPKGKAQKKAAKKAAKQKKKGGTKLPKTSRQKKNGGSPIKSIPGVMSAVTDGVNVGMVWKNSNQVRDHFNRRFEKVTDLVAASTAFALIQNFFLNPGNVVLFPVFSQIAATYEEFICHFLRFWYRGEEYMASGSNTSAGIVAMATNMDPDDSTFSNISQLENYEGSVSGPPFTGHFCHDVAETHKSRGRNKSMGNQMALNQYFVYSSANQAAPASSTSKFYDLGQFQVAINGCQAASPMGELWVEHEWTLIRRKQETPIGQNALYAHLQEAPNGTAATTTAYLGTGGGSVRNGSTIPVVTTNTTFTLPVIGTFLLAAGFTGSATSIPALSLGSNLAKLSVWVDGAATSIALNQSNDASIMEVITVNLAGTGAANTITISGLSNLAAGTADIFIAQVSAGVVFQNRKPSANQIADAYVALCERFDNLEKRLSQAPVLGLSLTSVSEPDTPCEEIKETELESSVHISKTAAEQLLRGLGLRK